jgi:hypothetical protein
MAKINERILNEEDLKQEQDEAQEEKKASKLIKQKFPEYGEIRVPKTWTNPPALKELRHDIDWAITEHEYVIEDINEYLDYYHTSPNGIGRPVKVKGRSNAQPQSIRKSAEWRYSSLSEPFLDSPNLFKAQPTTFLDVEGAKETQLVLNYQFRHQIDLVEFIDNYIKDLVDTGTAIIRTSWELKELSKEVDMDVVRYEEDERLAPVYGRMLKLMQEDPKTFKKQVPADVALALQKSIEENRPLRRIVEKTEKSKVIETVKNQPSVEICDYRDVIPDPTCRGKHEDMKFCGYRLRTTRAELMADGRYSNIDKINVAQASALVKEESLDYNGEPIEQDSDTFEFKDPNRQPIEGIEYWGFLDVDDSGILTPVVFTWFGDVLVRAEENPYPDKEIPFTFVPYLKKRNSLYGEPDGALLHEDQKISGAITRGVIDILAKNANGQRGIPKGALDYSNLMLYREGKDYEFNPTAQIGRDGITQITKFPEIPQSAIAIQQLAENSIKEMTGTLANQPSQNHGNGLGTQLEPAQAAGMSRAARRELGILRRVAGGIIEVGHKICAMNKEFLDDEEVIRITDQDFTTIQRENLDCSYDLALSISTAEDDSVKAQELAFMLQTSTGVMDQDFVRELLADIADLRRMPDKAEKYRRFQPQPDPLEEKKKQLEIQKLQVEIQEIQTRAQENSAEAQREMANAKKLLSDANLADSKADAIDLKYVEDETGLSHSRDIEKQMAQAKGNIELEKAKHELESQLPEAEPIPTPKDNLTDRENIGTNAEPAPENLLETVAEDDEIVPQSLETFEDELQNVGATDELLKE